MYRIAGVNIPPNKHIVIGLTSIFGVGRSLSTKILKKLDLNPQTKSKDLSEDEVNLIREELGSEEYKVEGELRREIAANIKRLSDIGSLRGYRHRRGLPVRGQRTKTNARTRKGPAKLVSGKKK